MGERRGAYRALVGKPEGRRPLERPRRGWEDNIKMDLREVGWGVDWIHLAQDIERWRALVNAVKNLQVPYNPGNFLTGLRRVSFSGRPLFHGESKQVRKKLSNSRQHGISSGDNICRKKYRFLKNPNENYCVQNSQYPEPDKST
jgi:hypothetical protein